MTLEAHAERIEQLREGMTGAGASLPPVHAEVGSRAVEAAGLLSARAAALAEPGTSPPVDGADRRLSEAVEVLEELHYRLCRVSILRDDPADLDVGGRLERAETLAEELEPLLPAAASGPAAGGETA